MAKTTFCNLKEARKAELLNRAGTCFMHMDYEEIRIEDLVKAMEIPVGSFYRYFEDKEDAAVTYFVFIETQFSKPMQIINVMEPIEPTEEEMTAYAPIRKAMSRLPASVFEKIIVEANRGRVFDAYKKFLTELKYDGKVRTDLDADLISFMYATTLYNLELYFRYFGIEDDKLRWKIKKYFYFTFFKYGIMGTEAQE